MSSCEGFPSWLDKNYIELMLWKNLNEKKSEIRSLALEPACRDGDSFVSGLIRIIVELPTRTLSLIAKVTGTELTQYFTEIEVMIYAEIMPHIKQRLKELKGTTIIAPEFYGADMDRNAFFMEDLIPLGYELHPGVLDFQHAVLAIEAFAILHGGSLWALQANPDLANRKTLAVWTSKKEPFSVAIVNNGSISLRKYSHFYGLSESCLRNIERTVEKAENEHAKVNDYREGCLNVFCHGDPRSRNMMFRYRDGAPVDVRIYDFQLPSYNCFAKDLLYFLFSSIKATVLVEHLDTLLEIYYKKIVYVAPKDAGITLERITSEFEERIFFAAISTLYLRSLFLADEDINLVNLIIKGQVYELSYNKPEYIADLKVLLPFLEKRGVWNKNNSTNTANNSQVTLTGASRY